MRLFCRTLSIIGILLLILNLGHGAKNCREGNQDIFFIAESSLSTSPTHFRLLKNFVRDVGKTLGVGQNKNRISLTLYNKEVRDVIDLKDAKDQNDLVDILGKTNHWTGGTKLTRAGNAMTFAVNEKFTEERGRRVNNTAICVFIIEGSSSDPTEDAALKLQSKCRVIVLGINKPNYYELSKIASPPIMGHVKTLQGYIDLIRFVTWVTSTICKPPIAPLRLDKERITHKSITITWELQPYAKQYVIHLRLSGKMKVMKSSKVGANKNSVTFGNLKEGTSYSFDGWAVGEDGVKGPRAVLYVSSGIKVPKVSLDTLTVTKTTAIITWPISKLWGVSYYVTIKEADTGQVFIATGVSGSKYHITKLTPGTKYSVELTAMYKGARSETDERLYFHTVSDPPTPVTKYVTDRAVRLEWNKVKGAAVYGIRTYDTESGEFGLLVRVDETPANTFEVQPLLSGKRYKFTVTSKTKEGQESEESQPVFERIAPSNPRKIELDSRTTKSIKISWKAQETVMKYMIQLRLSTSSDWLTRTVDTTSFEADGLLTGGMYNFRVFSIGNDSKTDTENPATRQIQTVPAKVDGVKIQKITENSVTLQWNKMRGTTEYELTFKDSATGKVLQTERIKSDTATVGDLKTGVTYQITVSAVAAGELKGKPSNPQMVVTLPGVPKKPLLSGKTNKTLTFKWEKVPGAIQYVLDLKEVEGTRKPIQYRTRDNSFTFEDLRPGTLHSFSLRSVGAGGRINMKPSESATGQTAPQNPDKPRITDLTASSVTIQFDKVKGATGYLINIRLIGRKKLLEKRNTTDNVYRIANLASGESYTAGVIAYSADGSMSAESKLTLMKTMPGVPEKPRVVKVSSTTATLEWDEVKAASAYIISISDKRKLTEVKTEDTTYIIEGLKPSTQYSFGLYSVAIEGTRNEKESERVEALTAPRPPTDVRIMNAGMTYVELAWNAVRGAVSYIVRYKSTGDDEGLEEGELEANNPSFQSVSKLTAGVIYEFSVIAVGSDGSRSDPGILIDGTLPATPDKPLVLLIGSTTATLSWNDAKGATSYIIKASARGFNEEFKSNTTRVEIDGLQSGSKYEFSLMSVGINGRVNYYESEKKREQTLTSAPTNFKLLNFTTTTVDLSWDKMKGAVYYAVTVKLGDDTPVQKFVAFKTTYTVKRLTPGLRYKFQVASVGTNFIESNLSPLIVTSTIPATPQAPEVVKITSSTVDMKWKPVIGAEKYIFIVQEEDKDEKMEYEIEEAKVKVSDLKAGSYYTFFTYSVGINDRMNEKPSRGVNVQTDPAIPSDVAFVNATTSSITLKWNAMKGTRHYKIFVTKDDESVTNVTSKGNTNSIWGLEPGTVYTFTVKAFGEEGGETEKSDPVTASTATYAPMQPIITDMTSTEATLEWDDIPGAIKYFFSYMNHATGERKTREVETAKIILDDLAPGTWYDFAVSSVGEGGKHSEESDILDEQTVPIAPANVRGKIVGMDYITVVWDKSEGASSYRLTYTWKDVDNELRKKSIKTEKTTLKFGELVPGTGYEIIVTAVGQTGSVSLKSRPLVENTIPSTPSAPVIDTITDSAFNVKWERVKGASSYVIEIMPEVGKKYFRETERTEWVEEGKKAGKWFKINIQSRDSKNRGNGIASDTLELQTVCERPSNVKMSEIGTTWAKISWNDVEGVDFYIVTIIWSVADDIINTFGAQEFQDGETVLWEGRTGIKKDGLKSIKEEQYKIDPSQVAVKDHNAWFRLQTRTNKIEIVGLDPATSYAFQIQSVNQQGRVSMQKSYLNETTLPNKVEFVSLLGITDSSAMLAWDAVEGIEKYIVNITSQSNGRVKTHVSKTPSITLQQLTPGSWYNAEIFTVGKDGNMNYEGSEELSFQTIPSQPKNFEVTNITTTTVDLVWEASEGVSFYKVIIRLTKPFRVVFRADEVPRNHHKVEKLTPGTRYLFTVISVATGGRESRASKLLMETTTPARPTDLKLMDITTTTANLQWNNVIGANKFIVGVKSDEGTMSEVETRGTVIKIEDLTPGVWYEFWVRSVGQNGIVNYQESNIIRQQTVPRSPGVVKVEETTTTTIAISWRKVHGIKQYQVYVEEAGDTTGKTLQIFNVTRSFITLTRLTPGMTYSISVIAIGTGGERSLKSDPVVQSTVPGSIEELNVTDISTTHVELTWTDITGAAQYTISMRMPGAARILKTINTRQSTHIVSPLEPGTTYIFSVSAIGKNKRKSGDSPEIQVQTTPLSPAGVTKGEVTTTSVNLKWKKVQGVIMYRVVVKKEETPDVIWRTDEVQKLQHTVAELTPGTTYVISVESVGTNGRQSDSSEVITATTIPEKPSGLELTSVTKSMMTLKWNPVSGARYYTVYITGDDKFKKEINAIEPKTTIPALTPGKWYNMNVVAMGKGKSSSERSNSLRDQTAPLAPTKLLMTKTGTTSISFQWEPVIGVKFYEVTLHADTVEGRNIPQTFVSDETEYTVNQLMPGVPYVITVVGVGTSGRKSDTSKELRQTTVPAALDEVTISDATTTSITLRWNEITGASSYTIVIRAASDSSKSVLRTIESTSTMHTVPALVPGENYFFSIRSKGYGGKISKESPRVEAQTVPLPPSKVQVDEVGTTSISLSWKDVNGAGFYKISIRSKTSAEVKTDDVKTNKYKAEGLKPGTEYVFTISAVGTSGRESKKSSPVSQVTKPAGPTGVELHDIQTDSMSIKWDIVTGAISYKVTVQPTGGIQEEYDSLSNKYFLTDLLPGTEYTISVSSIGADGQRSSDSERVVEQTIPSSPSNLRILETLETAVTFEWRKMPGAVEYIVIVKEPLTGTERRIESDGNQITVEDLSPGTSYEFSVLSVGIKNRINPIQSKQLTEQTVSSPVQGLQIGSVTTTTVQLLWSRSPGVKRYIIKVRDHNTGVIVETYNVIVLQQLVEDLQPGKNYSFTVTSIAKNGHESDESEEVVVSTEISTPNQPTPKTITNSSVSLTWDEVEGAREYIVVVHDVEKDTRTRIRVEEEFVLVTDLQAGSKFSFSLIAMGASGITSAVGEPVSVYTIPATPKISKVVALSTNSIRVSWNKVKGAVKYMVLARWRRPGQRRSRVTNITTTLTSHDFEVPLPGMTYDFNVLAEGMSGQSKKSDAVQENSLPEAPPAPTASKVSSSTARLTWETVPGATSYEAVIFNEATRKDQTMIVYRPIVQLDELKPGTWYKIQLFSRDAKNRQNKEGSSMYRIQTVPRSPPNMRISEASTDAMTVAWSNVYGAKAYYVTLTTLEDNVVDFGKSWENVEPLGAGKLLFNIKTEENFVNVEGLKPGSQIEFEVQAIGEQDGLSEPTFIEASMLVATVEDIDVKKVSTNFADLQWFDVKGVSFYRVQVKEDGTARPDIHIVTQPALSLTNLTPGTWYDVTITTYDVENRTSGIRSKVVEFQTIPRQIEKVGTSEVTTNGMIISWEEIKGAKSYELKLLWIADEVSEDHLKSDARQDRNGFTHKIFRTPLTEVALSQLDSGTSYWYEVTSLSQEGRSSEPSKRRNETTLPSGITEITVRRVTNTLVSLSWDAIKGAEKYTVQITTPSEANPPMKRQTTRSAITVGDLQSGVTYKFVVLPLGVKGKRDEVETASINVKTIPMTPEAITVEDVTETSISVSWTPTKGSARYQVIVEYKDEGRQLQTLTFETKQPRYKIVDLLSGVVYSIKVVAFGNNYRDSGSGKSKAVVQRTLLTAPQNLVMEDYGEDFIAISWGATTGANSYTIHVTDVETGEVTPIDVDNNLSMDVTNLTPGVVYSLSVVGVNSRDNMKSGKSIAVVQRTKPSAPQDVRVSVVGATAMSIEWEPVTGASSYTIFLTERGIEEFSIPDQTTSSIELIELQSGTEYRIQVIAITEDGIESDRSNRVTQVTAPNAPGTPVVKTFSTDSMTLQWEKMKGAATYIVSATKDGGSEAVEYEAGSSLEFEIKDLEPGTVYSFTVRGENLDEGLKSDESDSVTQETYPVSPDVQVVSFSPDRISLKWDEVKGADSYTVFVTEVDSLDGEEAYNGLVTTEFTIEDLQSGGEYEIQAIAITRSGLRSSRSLMITQSTSPNSPTGLTISNVTQNAFTVSWIPAAGATSYTLILNSLEASDRRRIDVDDALEYKFTKLKAGIVYSVYAYALTLPDNTRSERSEPVQQRTLPLAPRGVIVFDVKEDSVSLEWKKSKGATTYTIFINKLGDTETLERQVKNLPSNIAVIDRLSSGSLYQFEVAAVTEDRLVGKRSNAIQQQTVPASPQDISISDVTSTSFTVNWTRSEGATSYQVKVVNEITRDERTRGAGNKAMIKFDRLTPGGLYRITVRAQRKDADVISRPSYRLLQRTLPAAPRNFEVTGVTSESVALQWRESNGAVSYQVSIFELDEDGKTGDELFIDNIEGNSIEVIELDPGTSYMFEVLPVTTEGFTSDQPSIVTETTRYPVPVMPSSDKPLVRLSNIGSSAADAEWSPIRNAFTYTLIAFSEDSPNEIMRNINGTSAVLKDLRADTDYSVTLIAVGRSGDETVESDPPALMTTLPLPPVTPSELATEQPSKNSIVLSWEPSDGALSYEILMVDPVTKKRTTFKDIEEPRYEIKSLRPGRKYSLQVIAIGRFEKSEISKKLMAGPKYPVPVMEFYESSPIEVSAISWNTFTMTFPTIEDAVTYKLILRKEGELFREIKNIRRTRYPAWNLTEFTTFEVTYQAVGAGGDVSEESDPPLYVTTEPHTPQVPQNPKVSDETAESAVIEWDDADRAVAYDVIVTDLKSNVPTYYENIPESPYIITGLVFDTRYAASVVSIGKYDRSRQSKQFRFKTKIPKPGDIRIIRTQFVSEDEIHFLWSPASYAVSYTITVKLNDKVVQKSEEVLGNRIKLENLKPDTTYDIGVKAIGLEKDEGNEIHSFVTTLSAPEGFEELGEDINEFGIDENLVDSTEEPEEIEEATAKTFPRPESLEEALSSLVAEMMRMPDNEITVDGSGKEVIKKSSPFRRGMWGYIEIVRKYVVGETEKRYAERKSDVTILQQKETEDVSESMEKLIFLSRHLRDDPKDLGRSGARKVASEISELLTDIFMQSPEMEDIESSGQEDIQAIMTPIIEELLLEIILGKFQVTTENVSARSITLAWSGKLPSDSVDFQIKEVGVEEFKQTITVDKETSTVKFTKLDPSTDYGIFVVSTGQTDILHSQNIKTKQGVFVVAPAIPTGVRTTFVARSYLTLRWRRVKGNAGANIVYIVRIYRPKATKPIERFRMQKETTKNITKLKSKTTYEITVSAFDVTSKKQSKESPRLRVRTK